MRITIKQFPDDSETIQLDNVVATISQVPVSTPFPSQQLRVTVVKDGETIEFENVSEMIVEHKSMDQRLASADAG